MAQSSREPEHEKKNLFKTNHLWYPVYNTRTDGRFYMTLVQLTYFMEVVRQGSFTKAAEKLFVSQPALSKSIRSLEQEFETDLIDRSAKDFQLTREGELFLEYAHNILSFYRNQTQELYQRLHSGQGVLRLGMPPTAGTVYFYTILNRFRREFPDVELQITESLTSKRIKEQMDSGNLDLGIMIEPFRDEKYHIKRVYLSEAVLVVSHQHPLAGQESISVAKLTDEPFLLIGREFMFHDVLLEYCRAAGYTPNVVFESMQWDLLLEMVVDNQGVSILPKPLVDKCYNTRVREIHLQDPEFPWALDVIWRKDHYLTVPMQRFLQLCSKE